MKNSVTSNADISLTSLLQSQETTLVNLSQEFCKPKYYFYYHPNYPLH